MTEDYEFILIGSGAAGSTIAKELLQTNSNTSILILEAGPEVSARDRRHWWDYVVLDVKPYAFCYDQPGEYKTSGNVNWDFRENRVMAYGGSTLHWGGWSLRFKPEDFRLFTNTKQGVDWPFDYDHLEKFYCRAESFLSVCGDDAEDWQMRRSAPFPMPPFDWTAADGEMIEGFYKCGIKPGKMPLARYRRCMTTGTCKYCPLGSRYTSQHVLDDLLKEGFKNLKVLRNSPVKSLVVQSKKELVDGVIFIDGKTGEEKLVTGKTVVVCSGTYESPKLLLTSQNTFWSKGIGNDYDQVGHYIVSHSMLKVTGETQKNAEHWSQEYDFPTLMSRSYDTPEFQEKGKLFLFKDRVKPNVDFARLMISGKTRTEIDEVVSGPRRSELQAFLEEKGKYQNHLKVINRKNRFGLYHTEVSFSRTKEENENAQARLKLLEKVIEKMNYKIVYSKVEDPGGHHATGTCRMHRDAKLGVVDANLLVHGTDNLYVCSNAALPTCSAVNPTLTLTAMAMRLADHFVETHKLKAEKAAVNA